MPLHCAHFSDLSFVGIPFETIGIDLVLESVRVQDGCLTQKPFVAKDVKFKLSLPVAPAGYCVWTMHRSTSTWGCRDLLLLDQPVQLRQEISAATAAPHPDSENLVYFEGLARRYGSSAALSGEPVSDVVSG
jgi:hypothetical protein